MNFMLLRRFLTQQGSHRGRSTRHRLVSSFVFSRFGEGFFVVVENGLCCGVWRLLHFSRSLPSSAKCVRKLFERQCSYLESFSPSKRGDALWGPPCLAVTQLNSVACAAYRKMSVACRHLKTHSCLHYSSIVCKQCAPLFILQYFSILKLHGSNTYYNLYI